MTQVLTGDIGGTKINLALVSENFTLSCEKTFATKDYTDFPALVKEYLKETGKSIKHASFAAAGPNNAGRIQMTNSPLVVDQQELQNLFNNVLVMNDFDALGWSLNILQPSDLFPLNQGVPQIGGTRALIGAGTGLGKSIVPFINGHYSPIASEGGHADLPLHSEEEFHLFSKLSIPHPLSLEDLISGPGLERIFHALSPNAPQKTPRQISEGATSAFELFVRLYARAAKNFALETLSLGGLFIAGGIAASHPDKFLPHFMKEFTLHNNPRYRKILQDMPVFILKDANISLKGAAFPLIGR